MKFFTLGPAAKRILVPEWKLARLRRAGYIPEAVQIGIQHVYPEAALDEIRSRLILAGLIEPADEAAPNASLIDVFNAGRSPTGAA